MKPEQKELSEEILPFVSSLVGKQVRAKASKFGLYATGGGFSAASDTPKSGDHVGTLLVVLPTNFTGGDLVVKNKDKEETMNWAEKLSSSSSDTGSLGVRWAFIGAADTEYSIRPIDSGLQLILSYDIIAPKPWMESSSASLDSAAMARLQQCLSNPKFLPEGGKLAFALTNAYPIRPLKGSAGRDFFKNEFHHQLRGADALFYSAATTLGLKIEMRTVYNCEDGHDGHDISSVLEKYYDEEPDWDTIPNDDSSAMIDGSLLLTSQKMTFFKGGLLPEEAESRYERDGLFEQMVAACEAEVELDVIWARRPSKGAYTATGAYADCDRQW
jgi:hypothetical protein